MHRSLSLRAPATGQRPASLLYQAGGADDVSSQQEIKRGDRLDEGWSGAGNVHGCADRTGRAQSVPVIDVRSAKPQRGAYPQARHRAEPVRVGNEYLSGSVALASSSTP